MMKFNEFKCQFCKNKLQYFGNYRSFRCNKCKNLYGKDTFIVYVNNVFIINKLIIKFKNNYHYYFFPNFFPNAVCSLFFGNKLVYKQTSTFSKIDDIFDFAKSLVNKFEKLEAFH